jgi:hypothetical protein
MSHSQISQSNLEIFPKNEVGYPVHPRLHEEIVELVGGEQAESTKFMVSSLVLNIFNI